MTSAAGYRYNVTSAAGYKYNVTSAAGYRHNVTSAASIPPTAEKTVLSDCEPHEDFSPLSDKYVVTAMEKNYLIKFSVVLTFHLRLYNCLFYSLK